MIQKVHNLDIRQVAQKMRLALYVLIENLYLVHILIVNISFTIYLHLVHISIMNFVHKLFTKNSQKIH